MTLAGLLALHGRRRIQQRRTKGWRKPDGVISVARGTDWGNPFRVGDTLDLGDFNLLTITPELAVALYAAHIEQHHGPGIYEQIRDELGGAVLMCWCKVGDPCHGDWLAMVALGCTATVGANPTDNPDFDRCRHAYHHAGDHEVVVGGRTYRWPQVSTSRWSTGFYEVETVARLAEA